MQRRTFLSSCVAACTAGSAWPLDLAGQVYCSDPTTDASGLPTNGIIPVVADGKWVWKQPPDGKRGYLEPRKFRVTIGIRLEATGPATDVIATTGVPVELPEQTIAYSDVQPRGCRAGLRQIGSHAQQLVMAVPRMVAGQQAEAIAEFELVIRKQHHGFHKDQFPKVQDLPKRFPREYLTDSPGVQVRHREIKALSQRLAEQHEHPWDKALAFKSWVEEQIEMKIGYYTSSLAAIRKKIGDCEERAGVFVSLCRAAQIPARLVLVPSHIWPEFCLVDHQQQPHWIPCHTSAYFWTGWVGVHEVILQKGDKLKLPEKGKRFRLNPDWLQYRGRQPAVRYLGKLEPIAANTSADPGPGARVKDERGFWAPAGSYAKAEFVRQ